VARLIRGALPWAILLALIFAAYVYGRDYVRKHPQDVPWTPLRLDDPVGAFTLRKLVSLSDEPAQCRSLLNAAGSADLPAPPRQPQADCGYVDGMRLVAAPGEVVPAPGNIVTRCSMAAALLLWERRVLQPAAQKHLGQRVRRIDHAGSYSCRRLYNRSEGAWSEHATANAFDILGFRLADGSRVSVMEDWSQTGPKAAFLRDVRDGACKLFATVLGPDYNRAHADHLHFDHAARGRTGFALCR
jgi:hypothetical protein